MLNLVKGWLGDIDMSTLNQEWHLPVQQRQQQGTDVRAIDIGVSHDDDAVIAQLLDIEFVRTNRRTQGRDQRSDLF